MKAESASTGVGLTLSPSRRVLLGGGRSYVPVPGLPTPSVPVIVAAVARLPVFVQIVRTVFPDTARDPMAFPTDALGAVALSLL